MNPSNEPPKLLSVVIPAHNEEGCIQSTLRHLHTELDLHKVPHEIVVVDDHSSDTTPKKLEDLKENIPGLTFIKNEGEGGFGNAILLGIQQAKGDAIIIMMADESDDPREVVHYWKTLCEHNCDCVFGSRFIQGGGVIDYPPPKYTLNRLANWFIQILFQIELNDTTNAFKAYRTHVLQGIQPILSKHFNLTVELPLKAIVRGYTYKTIPITWRNRKTGESKLKIKEMGSRYLFIVLYIFLEKILSQGDYHRKNQE